MRDCPVCSLSGTKAFFNLDNMPVSIGTLWGDAASARSCPTGDMQLVYCPRCGLIYNAVFDEAKLDYGQDYNNSLHFSPVYQEYAEATASRLVEKYDLRKKNIIEIGCGKGDFLVMLCQYGDNIGVGFDNSYEDRELQEDLSTKISFINDLYQPSYAHYRGDLICSRYVLEHIATPVEFLRGVREMVHEERPPVLYFEVPNAMLVLEKLSVWDLIYEHCLYFTQQSLQFTFESSGFETIDVYDGFGGQFVSIESRPAPAPAAQAQSVPDSIKVEKVESAVEKFPGNYQSVMETWQNHLQQIRDCGSNAVLWGAGAKGVSFLNLLNIVDEIKHVVDINPGKKGKYIAGTGQEIISPEQLYDHNPDLVVILNPNYKDEISVMLRGMVLSPEILCFE